MSWPVLPWAAWTATRESLHMYVQIVGKIKLALAPKERAWSNVALYVSARGLTTNAMPCDDTMLQIDFDFADHTVQIFRSDGATRTLELASTRSVAQFYDEMMAALRDLGIVVAIRTLPAEIANPIAFTEQVEPRAYDPDAAHRFWQILVRLDSAFRAHRAPFRGRHTEVQFFWGSFDLAYARFSGKPAAPPPNADSITRFAMDAEEVATGFWFGDARFPEPAFYCYGYPKPPEFERASILPAAATWNDGLGEFVLPYEAVLASESPPDAIRDFLQSTYDACATRGGWDAALLAAPPS